MLSTPYPHSRVLDLHLALRTGWCPTLFLGQVQGCQTPSWTLLGMLAGPCQVWVSRWHQAWALGDLPIR